MTRTSICMAVVATALLAARGSLAQANKLASPISVSPNVHVSTYGASQTHNEVLVAADPSDATRVMACVIVGRSPTNELLTAVYSSFDSGATWTATTADSSGAAGDPACEYGPGGHAYFTSLSRSWG